MKRRIKWEQVHPGYFCANRMSRIWWPVICGRWQRGRSPRWLDSDTGILVMFTDKETWCVRISEVAAQSILNMRSLRNLRDGQVQKPSRWSLFCDCSGDGPGLDIETQDSLAFLWYLSQLSIRIYEYMGKRKWDQEQDCGWHLRDGLRNRTY